MAIGTGAFAVSANAFANLAAHARAGNVRWRDASAFAAVGMAGAAVGSRFGKGFDGQRLLFLFALLMVAVGALMLRGRGATPSIEPAARTGSAAGRPARVAACCRASSASAVAS